MSMIPHKCRCGQCFLEMPETVEQPRGALFDQLLVLTLVAGHLHRSGEHHSAETIIEVQEKLYTGLADALQKAKEGAVAQWKTRIEPGEQLSGRQAFLASLRQYEFDAMDCGSRPVIKLSVDDIEKDFLDGLKFEGQPAEDKDYSTAKHLRKRRWPVAKLGTRTQARRERS